MTKHVRFSLDKTAGPTTPDADASVRHGLLDGDRIQETARLSATPTGASHALSDVRLLPPVWPSKIICVGKNYADHAREMGSEPPAEPILFFKPPSSLVADGDPVVYPKICGLLSYEGEFGVVIGSRCRHVSRSDADNIIFGYTVINDFTARDIQRKDSQWTRGKGFDTFCPTGPWIVPKDEVNIGQVRVQTRVDGAVKQDSPLTDLMFGLDVIIAYVTEFLTLEPGDLIATGTPPGVGGVDPGSVVEVTVTGVGKLTNKVIAEETR